jgi:hypothetical protein
MEYIDEYIQDSLYKWPLIPPPSLRSHLETQALSRWLVECTSASPSIVSPIERRKLQENQISSRWPVYGLLESFGDGASFKAWQVLLRERLISMDSQALPWT